MNQADKMQIINRYRQRLKEFGPNIEALASGTPERRQIRFQVLSSIGNLTGCSLLDLGCGFADFYAYLLEQGIKPLYTGYDINPDVIQVASKRFPEASFEVRDIQMEGIPNKFDFIVASQTFNNKYTSENNMDVIQDVICRCYESCTKGVAIDMMTSYVDFKEDHLFYYSPEEIFHYCKSFTKRVALRHDYPLFEFTVALYRDFQGWRK